MRYARSFVEDVAIFLKNKEDKKDYELIPMLEAIADLFTASIVKYV